MKLDVSDLFDHLYDVASFARARFDLSQTIDGGDDSSEWDTFCNAMSDQLFLPACASRSFGLTHVRMASADVKTRIITERSPETGTKILFCRYVRPYFRERPSFFASPTLGEPHCTSIFTRPKHKLILWLGKLPPDEIDVTPPAYPTNLDAPIRYYARQRFGFISRSPHTSYYEFHGHWCLRQVDQQDASFARTTLGGQWRQIDELTEIPKDTFDTMWASALDEPAT